MSMGGMGIPGMGWPFGEGPENGNGIGCVVVPFIIIGLALIGVAVWGLFFRG